ncbi:anhydro-N-acetylmuramic acid kinase [Fulvimarina manganoxydans]|uniref:Anhydro-N-acetylmuramic acid kinase n=1 Tax=Fulvimarina manganoxydans TaxID=937218 RepID=A0A1W2BP66_9HYPH|nr:anhydro-N-acetylmuramic acid kinase [Fulvimarina manganoxydans]SMC74462.1 anhydro-N-acetylmuramic acid kinase [Fulvimarina manganoxydans]
MAADRMGWAIGLMTGTVLDGNIDIAMIRTDGETVAELGPFAFAPYPAEIRALLVETLAVAREWGFSGPEPEIFAKAEDAISVAQAEAVLALLSANGFAPSEVAAIGFHGQTVLHRAPEAGRPGRTRQLGDGARMAAITGIDVVYDFRSADMRAGGQGAPLAGIYHKALLERIDGLDDTAFLNLGGVANLTFAGAGPLIAFDTGPANAPVNDWIAQHGLGEMDRDGKIAASGKVDEARLAELLTHPYLTRPFPKSLDRFDFPSTMAQGQSLEDGAALLTAFTASAVGKALDLLPKRPRRLVACGGGRKNPTLMAEIAKRGRVEVVDADALGLRGDAIEAELFALLAMRTMRGLPSSFPTTTGAAEPTVAGVIAKAPG